MPKFLFHYIGHNTLVKVPDHSSQTLWQYKQQAKHFLSTNWQRLLEALMPTVVMPVQQRNRRCGNYIPAFNFSYTQHKNGFRGRQNQTLLLAEETPFHLCKPASSIHIQIKRT